MKSVCKSEGLFSPTTSVPANAVSVLSVVLLVATVLEPRTVELKLKEGENDIAVLLQQPKDRASIESGLSRAPMRVAAGLACEGFTCLDPGRDLELDADDAKIEIGDEL